MCIDSVCLVLAAALVQAQETTTGSIAGRVVDAQGLAVPGATVTVTTPQGPRTFTTDSDGAFFAPFLTPGMYEVKVELQGFRTLDRQNIEVRLGQRVELSLPLQVGSLTESVNVSGSAPVVDTSSTTTGAVLDSDMLQRIPVGRRFSDTLYIAPGVSSGGQVGEANPSMSGGSGLENQYVVDGVNITNAGYGALGSYSIVFGSLGNGVPFDFIKETQVKTGGYEAEFGQSTGGVVNVVTKSGTNTLRGSAFGYFRPDSLESSYDQVTTVNGTVNVTQTRRQRCGGRGRRRDRAESRVLLRRDRSAVAANHLHRARGLPASQPWRRGSGSPDRRLRGEGHLADRVRPSSRRVVLWRSGGRRQRPAALHGPPANGHLGVQQAGPLRRSQPDGEIRGRHHVPPGSSKARSRAPRTRIVEIPSVDDPSIVDNTVTPQGRSGGIGFFEVGNSGVNWQYQAKATNVIRHHSLRYGVEYENIDYSNTINRTGPTFTLPDGTQTATGAQIEIDPDPTFGQIFRVIRANTSNVRDTTQHYVNLFVQDTWNVGNRLTINPGVRYERQALDRHAGESDARPATGRRASARPTIRPAAATMKIYGNWGFFYSKIPNDLAARALSSDAGVSRADYFDLGLTQPVPDGVLALGTTSHFLQQGVSADVIDPNVKSSYVNEAVAGFEFEALPGMNVGVRYIHRDIPRVLEDVQPFPIVAGDLGIPGATTVDYTLTNPGPETPTAGDLGASFEKAIHRYNAIEVTADKRFADRWALQASYRYSRLRGTFEGFFRDDNGQSDPGITSLFDFPTNDPSYTAIGVPQFGYRGDVRFLGALGEGPLPLDRPHQAKVYGNYEFPFALNVGAGCHSSSGKPLTALAAHPVYGNSGEIPEGPRGSGFETIDGFRTRTQAAIHDGGARRLPAEHSQGPACRAAGRRVQPLQPAAGRSTTTRTRRRASRC